LKSKGKRRRPVSADVKCYVHRVGREKKRKKREIRDSREGGKGCEPVGRDTRPGRNQGEKKVTEVWTKGKRKARRRSPQDYFTYQKTELGGCRPTREMRTGQDTRRGGERGKKRLRDYTSRERSPGVTGWSAWGLPRTVQRRTTQSRSEAGRACVTSAGSGSTVGRDNRCGERTRRGETVLMCRGK